ncbi:MAG: ATP-binding protein [Bacteroidetes bacterium]|nr:ATP-binding protein [Bacteroidota bacterium]
MTEYPRPDASKVPDFLEDRGPAEYFHGRTKILDNFGKLLEHAVQTDRGTTFLIQGAPGVGKTALLEEMAIDAMENRWDVVKINFDDLYNPVHMAQTLGKPYISRKQTARKVDSKLLSIEHIKEVAGDSSVSHVLEKMNPKRGVLLILDEAQYIGRFFNTPNELAVTSTLNRIHNGELPHPVILLAAGLGMSKASFGDLGVSRFKGGCFVELGALSKGSERAVIHDWIIKEGDAKRDPTPWIDAIAQETHGWPQHITAYGDAAARQIQKDKGRMTPEGLEVVYRVGKQRREAYYRQRIGKFYGDQLQCLASSISNNPLGEPISRLAIISSLAKTYDDDKAEDLLKDFIEKGILEKGRKGLSIPIPSMHTWLKEEYGSDAS